MTLKLMTYAPTGALVAAPTPACPSSSAASATGTTATPGSATRRSRSTPCSASATPKRRGLPPLARRPDRRTAARAAPTRCKIMYRVDGSSDLDEEMLEHFEGYRGSRPVRIGNGAADQLQLDIYGEAMDSVSLGDSTACA